MNVNEIDRDVINGLVERWSVATAEHEEERARIPLKVLLGEAVDLAGVIDKYYDDQVVPGKTRLGLKSVEAKGAIHPKISTEMRELQLAVAYVQSQYLVLVEKASNAPIDQADDILNELRAGLTFVLEDGAHPSGEEQLESSAPNTGMSPATMDWPWRWKVTQSWQLSTKKISWRWADSTKCGFLRRFA